MLTKDTPWPSKEDIIDQTVVRGTPATLVDQFEAELFHLKRLVVSIHAEYDEIKGNLEIAEELAKREMSAFRQNDAEYLNSDEGEAEEERLQLAREAAGKARRDFDWSEFSRMRGLDHFTREIERHRTALAALYAKMGG